MKQKNKLDKKAVEHVAKLARIEISDEEKDIYPQQLSKILDYVDKLNEVDTESIDPVVHTGGLKNIMREDESVGCNIQEELIDAAPENEKDMIKVKAVLSGGKQ